MKELREILHEMDPNEPLSSSVSTSNRGRSKLRIRQPVSESDSEYERPAARKKKRQVRIWMDGAFDVMHYGHMNAFRQGKEVGTWLVVGVNTDKSIEAAKGAPPVLNDEERTTCVKYCKFVDEVEPNCPYVMNEEYLCRMIDKWKLDFIVHGDDPCIVDGKDVYQTARDKGMYRTIPRTEGVSTTEVGTT
jgi:ethanolamine-phosphate cytidylyltransferase